MGLSSQSHTSNSMRDYLLQIITFIILTASQEEEEEELPLQ
jgi:hypothetical protein